MLLNTFPFLVFFMVVASVYWRLPKRSRWVWLLAAGYYFYASWKPAYLGLMVITTAVNYVAARLIGARPRHKRMVLWLAIGFDLAVLLVFKYLNFFAVSLEQIVGHSGWGLSLPEFRWLLPLGISFYTFQAVGYLLDVYWGKILPEKHFGYLALFFCFFPQLAAGPIERAQELLPQLKDPPDYDETTTVMGMKLFVYGLFKKMVIADNLAIIVDRVYGNLHDFKGLSLVVVMGLFTWQIYADFSGYTDMARGVAKMLGYTLVKNFNHPYKATSIGDFWRRWHMSLSRWFKDYVYIPLGGSRRGWVRTVINTLIVFGLSGLWHGAAWTFVVWGLFHGAVIAMERLAGLIGRSRIALPAWLKNAYAMVILSISWVFFRADTIGDAWYVLRQALVGWRNFGVPAYVWATFSQMFDTNRVEMLIVIGLGLVAVAWESMELWKKIPGIFLAQPAWVRYGVYTLMVLMVVHLRNADIREFIYVRF